MRLPGLLRPPPSLADLEAALLATATRWEAVPPHWTVWLSPRDLGRLAVERESWSYQLSLALADYLEGGDGASEWPVRVELQCSPELSAGRFRVTGGTTDDPPPATSSGEPLPGRPRLRLPAGGTARWGTAMAAGIETDVSLTPGRHVVGRDPSAGIRLNDMTMSPRHVELTVSLDGQHVRLRDLGSLNGTTVDGVPAHVIDLVNGNRIELGRTTLVFQRDPTGEEARDAGRQGGEFE